MDINTKMTDGKTALQLVAGKTSTDVVRFLLDHNADISIQDEYG